MSASQQTQIGTRMFARVLGLIYGLVLVSVRRERDAFAG